MFCQKCGSQIGDGMRFCGNCGAPTAEAVTTEAAVPCEQTMTPAAAPKKNSEFAEKIKTTAKTIFKKIKGSRKLQIAVGAGLLVFIALIVLLFSTVLCGGAGAKKTLEKYVEAQRALDTDTLVELVPDSVIKYRVKGMEEGPAQLGKEGAMERVREMYGNNNLMVYDYSYGNRSENYILWHERGYADKANLKIIDKYVTSPSEVKEFNAFVKEHWEFDLDASKAVLFAYDISFDVNGENINYWDTQFCVCIKSGGEWGIITQNDSYLWRVYSRTDYRNKTVDWITSWIDWR